MSLARAMITTAAAGSRMVKLNMFVTEGTPAAKAANDSASFRRRRSLDIVIYKMTIDTYIVTT